METDYIRFTEIVERNLAEKDYDEEIRRKILDRIKAKYKSFFEVIDTEEDFLSGENCFGNDGGFVGLEGLDRDERVLHLRKCYERTGPVFPIKQIISNPLNEKGRYGRTALHDAVVESDQEKVIDLLKRGADPGLKDNNGHTPLMMAKFSGDLPMARFLRSLEIED